jgi:NADPH:quinone reductase-like Zn-dependent oxidoreductase
MTVGDKPRQGDENVQAVVQNSYGPPEILTLAEVDKPTVGEDDVLVRVCAASVDRGVWHLMTGRPYLVRVMGYGLRRPRTRVRGADVAGRVEAVGSRVTRFRPGDEVFGACDGTFAEYVCAPADSLARKPASLSFEQAATVPTSALAALQGIRDAGKVQSGQRVLVTGAAGGVGTFAVQIAKAFGAEVTAVCSTAKTDLVRSIGADHAIDYTREDFTTGSRRYDVILDIAGNRPLSSLRRALTRNGTLVIVGGEGGGRWLGGTDRQLRALAVSAFVRQRLRPMLSTPRAEDLQLLAELLEAGKVRPVVDRTYLLQEVTDAIRYLVQGKARGKVAITVPGPDGREKAR